MKKFYTIAVLLVSILSVNIALASDTIAERNKAADRYLQAMPIQKIMDDSTEAVSKNIPQGKRDAFVKKMHELIDIKELEKITKEAMVKTFTAEELNALADFYGSKIGKSAMKKFGTYMSEIMPHIQQELIRAGEEAQKYI